MVLYNIFRGISHFVLYYLDANTNAEEELKRMEEFRKAQAEVEQKKEKPMSQKMFKVV